MVPAWYLPILLDRKIVSSIFNEVFNEIVISQQMGDDERRKGKKATNRVSGIHGGLPLSVDYEAIYSAFVVPRKLGLIPTCP